MSHDELEFVEWLRQRDVPHPAIELGIGDDMAVVRCGGERLLFSSDMLLDGVHFDTKRHSYEQIGRKALACSLSDCAAMAVQPVAVTVSLAMPRSMTLADAKALYEGLLTLARQFDVALVGGDTARWDNPLAIDVAIMAMPYPKVSPVTRSNARVGDRLFVTGPLGGTILGHHLDFIPRVDEAWRLAQQLESKLHAMMDISDGLSLDLWRMCQASNVGAELHEGLLSAVISDDARRLSQSDGRPAMEHALSDGEDFELLLSVEDCVSKIDVPLFPIGEVTTGGFSMRRVDGVICPLEPRGFVH